MPSPIKRVEVAIQELRAGKMIVLTDHPDREDEGDLIFPAEAIHADVINFMIRNSSGIICLAMTAEKLKELDIPLMVSLEENSSGKGTPFTVSIEARHGVTTGVSAADRAATILAAAREGAKADDLVRPGHIFPLQAKAGGVLQRQGHTEGGVDLVRLAGFSPAAVLCEIMNADGTMTRGKSLREFAKQHDLKILSIEDLIIYRRSKENLIAEEVQARLPLEKYGEFSLSVIREKFNNNEHMVLSRHTEKSSPLVRIHSACMTGDLFGSKRCDCKAQLDYSLQKISENGGILIYLSQEGRGIGLFNKIKAYSLQEAGLDTVDANKNLGLPVDSREYHIAANIMRNRNIHAIQLMTNNLEKIKNLQTYGIENITREAMPVFLNECNQKYLMTKKEKLNHVMDEHFKEVSCA